MPKAKPYPDADEQEPTHMQSQWEDEASTTVEQGEVANKARELGKVNGQHNTGTHSSPGVDEPTVDDQHAPVLSAITPIRADNKARLVITAGNDAGQEIEIRPGKTWTVGRGLDNDVVLTDIAVSRKHFDLKFEDGAWIIVDRGSGNGTVVNGNVEDNPFMLAAGDQIEIGNTVFRYEQQNGVPRPPPQRPFDDDEEMSTVAGKPVRNELPEPPQPQPQPRPARPKTLPPPTPLRPLRPSSPPPPLAPLAYSPPGSIAPMPASTLPLPQMANRPPMAGPMVGPGAPTMMGDAMGMPMSSQNGQHPMLTTIPGQGRPSRPSYPYPQAAEIPPHSVHAQMLQIQAQNHRGDGSTAHVPPAPFDPMMYAGVHQRYDAGPPQLSRRTKLAAAGIALALLTGIVTAAVVKSGSGKPKSAASATKDTKKDKKADAKSDKKVTVSPVTDTPTPTVTPAPDPKSNVAKAPDPKPDTKAAETKQETPKVADKPTPKVADKQPEPKPETKQPEPKPERRDRERSTSRSTKRETQRREARREAPDPPPKRVAAASDTSGARDKAQNLYEAKRFTEAANVLAAAAKSASGDEASELRDKANKLRALQTAYSKASVPAQGATVTFAALQQALNLDNQVGGDLKGELNDKLAAVAPKAAVAFVAKKDWGNARTAYLAAKRARSTDPNLPLVNQKLEAFASELYAQAQKEASSSPGPAKEKLKQIKTLVDASSSIAVKAQALYNKL